MMEWKKPQLKSLGLDNTKEGEEYSTVFKAGDTGNDSSSKCPKPDCSSHKPGECPLS